MHETRPRADKTADKTSDAELGKTHRHRFLKHTEFPEMHRGAGGLTSFSMEPAIPHKRSSPHRSDPPYLCSAPPADMDTAAGSEPYLCLPRQSRSRRSYPVQRLSPPTALKR